MAPLPLLTAFESSVHSLDTFVKRHIAAAPAASSSTLSDNVKRSITSSKAVTYVGDLIRRQQQDCSIIPLCYGNLNSGPGAGTVVGIVIGAVGGFLLLLWLFYTCLNFGRLPSSSSTYTESVPVRSPRPASTRSKSQRSRRNSYNQETTSVRRSPPSPGRAPPPMAPPPPMMMQTPPPPPPQFRDERRSSRGGGDTVSQDESDEVVVIEEHESTPPRRKSSKSKRDSGESGYRTVDPGRYGGVVGGGRRDRR